MLFVYRGGLWSGRSLWTSRAGIAKDDVMRLVLFAILVLLLTGFLVNLLA